MFEQNDVCAVMNLREKKVTLFLDGHDVVSVRPNSSKPFVFEGKEYVFGHSKTFCEIRSNEEESKWKMVKMYNV